MTDIYFFFKATINVFWFGITIILLSEMYLAYTGNPRPEWLSMIESGYYALWSGFLWLKGKALG